MADSRKPQDRDDPHDGIAHLLAASGLDLLVTDSGLGGLSVVAGLDRLARTTGRYRRLHLDFASALGETGQGYNKLPSRERKREVFDDALAGMLAAFPADALLVACNTLSVLLPESRTLARAEYRALPVVGIVELGVAAVAARLAARPDAVAVLFATETTIAAGAHRAQLIAHGIVPERIVPLPCPGLASRIELEGPSPGVAAEIARFTREAVARCGGAPIVAALACTHYGYCAAEFASGLAAAGARDVEVLDPNRRMSGLLFPPEPFPACATPEVTVQVISRAIPLPGEIASVAALVERESPATATALRGYALRRDLFPFAGLAG